MKKENNAFSTHEIVVAIACFWNYFYRVDKENRIIDHRESILDLWRFTGIFS